MIHPPSGNAGQALEDSAQRDVERVFAALGAAVADVDRSHRRIDAGPERAAEYAAARRDVLARIPRVAELDARAGKRRKQRKIADSPIVGRSQPRRVLARKLVAIDAGDVEEPADAK